MASQHTTENSAISRISPLELGAMAEDMHNPLVVERLMGELCDENLPLANMLLSLAEREEETTSPDSRQQVAMRSALMIFGLFKRRGQIDDLETLFSVSVIDEVKELSA